jgi:hypothetical protein
MGAVKTSELPNGNIALEITYGGTDSPFGGVDTSAPPAYIDPRCFAAVDGFIVVDNKLCLANWQELALPELWNGAAATLIRMGTFFSSIHGQLNYALGVATNLLVGPPLATTYQFFMTAWTYNNAGNPQLQGTVDILNLKFFTITTAANAAALTIYPIPGIEPVGTTSGTLVLKFFNGGTSTGSATVTFAPGATLATLVPAMVTGINTGSGTTGISAAATVDGTGIILTAVTPGIAGNSLQVLDASVSSVSGAAPGWYFNFGDGLNLAQLQGGTAAVNMNPPQSFQNVSVAQVGGTIYIANVGPMILKYSGPGTLAVSTLFNGQTVLRKFGGALIGLGQIPQSGTIVQNTSMILSFSAQTDLDVWDPITTAGLVTGAGFEQLADIGDFLTGLIVSNGTAFIIRSQGISYASVTGNGTDPFFISHIGLGDKGEGSQLPQLVCQYDQTGAFVSNSDVLTISSGVTSIGAKIKSLLFASIAALENTSQQMGAASAAIALGGDEFAVVCFVIADTTFIYNPPNGTWTVLTYRPTVAPNFGTLIVDVLSIPGNQLATGVTQYSPVIAYQFDTGVGIAPSVKALFLQEGVAGPNSQSNPQFVTFPVEEVVFGRDVTIDSLYVAIQGDLTMFVENVTLTFVLNGLQNQATVAGVAQYKSVSIVYATLVLSPGDYNNVNMNPIETQIFSANQGAGAVTLRSPQLRVQVTPFTDVAASSLVRITKLGMYASFDPAQRPV